LPVGTALTLLQSWMILRFFSSNSEKDVEMIDKFLVLMRLNSSKTP